MQSKGMLETFNYDMPRALYEGC